MNNTVFRVEHQQLDCGLWYTKDGVYMGFVEAMEDHFLKTLPMGFDPNMVKDGLAWISGADSIVQMRQWLTKDAAKDLYDAGFKMFEIESSNVRSVPNHVVFERHSIIRKTDRTDLLANLWAN